MSPSKLSDIALPVREVTLTKLKTKSGAPVVVRCEAVAENEMDRVTTTLRLAKASGRLPGPHPVTRRGKAKADAVGPESATEAVRKTLKNAEPVIEIGCWIEGDDGGFVQAFCFCGKHPEAIPGRLLGMVDKMALFVAVMEEGGYSGGAADAARFPDDQGGGTAGVGVVGAGKGDRDAAGGPADGSDPPGD